MSVGGREARGMGLAPPQGTGVMAGARHCRMTSQAHCTRRPQARPGGGRQGAGRAETRRQPTVSTALVSALPGMLAQRRTVHVERGKPMTEEGMLSIMRRGTTYQARYASSDPHALERQPYPCPDEGALVSLLHHCGLEPWSLHRALAELRHGRLAVLPIVLAEAQRQRYFPLAQGPLTSAPTAATPYPGQCSG